jgi:parvulin-like peptidyl-prolyl isomerase
MTHAFSRRAGLLAAAVSVAGFACAQEPPKLAPATPPAETKPTGPPPPVAPKPAPKKPAVKLPSNVVARVGTQDITRDDVLGMFNMVSGRPIVDQMVQASLLEQEAKRVGVSVSAAELEQGIKQAKDQIVQRSMMMGTPKTFQEIAAEEGFSDNLIRWSVRLDLLRRKTFAKDMDKQLPGRDDQVKLAHILVATIPLPNPNSPEPPKPLTAEEQKKKDEEAKAKIDGILADIKAGKITFEDAAAKYSDDKSNNAKGGELDFYEPGKLDPAFEKAGFAIKNPGEIVGPVKSNFGWHLIKLVKRGKDLTPAEKATYKQQQVESMMQNPQMMQNWINSLRANRTVVINRQAQIVPGAKTPPMPVTPSKPASTTKKASAQ